MIGVIADDLTGAAEIGAVGLRHGLAAEIVLAPGESSGKADLICFDSDSRSCSAEEAAGRAAGGARMLRDWRAEWIYKKVDSVLRGQVVAEVEAVLKELGFALAVLAPANPSLGRTIQNGHYLINNEPIDKTEFARDPEHPRSSSSVVALLGGSRQLALQICRPK